VYEYVYEHRYDGVAGQGPITEGGATCHKEMEQGRVVRVREPVGVEAAVRVAKVEASAEAKVEASGEARAAARAEVVASVHQAEKARATSRRAEVKGSPHAHCHCWRQGRDGEDHVRDEPGARPLG
jgi:hypothetical protein